MDVTPKTTSLIVPDAAVKYIAFQRTEVLRFRKTLSYAIFRKLLGASFYNYRVERESRNDADRIKRFYADDIAREFSTIERYRRICIVAYEVVAVFGKIHMVL